MNLIEAVKSGRPFKRKTREDKQREWHHPESWSKNFLKTDILADDWETQEPTITITRQKFLDAARETWEDDFDKTRQHPEQFSLMLARKLGLEP